MGLSASQARYLMLVAKQSDLQYQGQQINQERTVLSQQVSELYNSLLAMEVPTPPSTTAYTKITYACTNGTTQYSFDANGVKPSSNGQYIVTLNRTAFGHYMETNDGYKSVKKESDGTYTIAGEFKANELTVSNIMSIMGVDQAKAQDLYNGYKQAIEHARITDSEGKLIPIDSNNVANYYFYIDNDEKIHFALRSDVEDVDSMTQQGTVTTYDYNANGKYQEIENKDECKLQFDAGTGRITHISIPVSYGTDGKPTSWTTLALTATQKTDEAAYKDAYAQYEYKKYLYDKEQQDINAKTEIIQQEDRNLELKLQRLDTENNEIKTELDAVKEVLKNNIEGSYKTFSG